MQQYAPGADPNIPYHTFGWAVASSFHKAMEAAGCPTREGLRDSVRNLQNVQIDTRKEFGPLTG